MLSSLPLSRSGKRKREFSIELLEDRLNFCVLTAEFVELCLPDLPDAAPAEVMRAADSINQFGNDLYQHFEAESGNLFLSPLSITTALAMTLAAADGETAAEIEQVFHFGTEPGIHDSFRELLQFRAADDKPFELNIANAQWPAIDFTVRDEFSARISSDYGGTSQALDYSQTEQARDTINTWVSGKTNNNVRELLKMGDLTPSTPMVLTNAIHFDAQWAIPFDPMLTSPGSFVRSPGDEVVIPTMYQESSFRNTEHDGFQILELPYAGGETSMVIFLPPDGQATYDLPATMLPYANDWLSTKPEPQELDVWLPKFKNTVPSRLKDVLIGMGMPTAFTSAADFSQMTPGGGVWISKVIHEASVEVNEQGTEASAATAVVFGICFAAGTPVLTPDGEKTIETLRVGDQVLARDENSLEGANEFKAIEKTFERTAETMTLHVGGQIIQTTSEHPFFVQGRGWTKAGEIEAGNLLSTSESGWMEVEEIVATGEQQTVYNIQVADHHTYFVGSKDWGFAVWVHNRCGDEVPQFKALRPFHYVIRDNATSATLFMGRITDPTVTDSEQLRPKVGPVERTAGDVDGNQRVDFEDLYIVTKNVGKNDAVWEDGDLDLDGKVALNDFIIVSDFLVGKVGGDMDRDGTVGFDDFLAFSMNFGEEVDSYYAGDFNVDGEVGFEDFLILSAAFGKSSAFGR